MEGNEGLKKNEKEKYEMENERQGKWSKTKKQRKGEKWIWNGIIMKGKLRKNKKRKRGKSIWNEKLMKEKIRKDKKQRKGNEN